jgi:DDB1- and CUL4-associated factor 11
MSIEESESGNRDDGEGNGYDDLAYDYWHRPPSKTPKGFPPVTVPQDAGLELLRSGEFGRTGLEARSRKGGASFAKAILSRRSRLGQTSKQDIANVRAIHTLGISFMVSVGYDPEHQWYGCCVPQ